MRESSVSYKSSAAQAARRRIALLEDSPAEAQAVMELLVNNGHEVVHQKRGEAFLEMLQRDSFDILILDWSVPDLSGYSVLRRVRELETQHGIPAIPAIALTSHTSSQDRLAALSAGFQMHIGKPVELAELVLVIRSLIGNKRKEADFSGENGVVS